MEIDAHGEGWPFSCERGCTDVRGGDYGKANRATASSDCVSVERLNNGPAFCAIILLCVQTSTTNKYQCAGTRICTPSWCAKAIGIFWFGAGMKRVLCPRVLVSSPGQPSLLTHRGRPAFRAIVLCVCKQARSEVPALFAHSPPAGTTGPSAVPFHLSRRREFCHFDDTPSSSLLKHLTKVEGGAAE